MLFQDVNNEQSRAAKDLSLMDVGLLVGMRGWKEINWPV